MYGNGNFNNMLNAYCITIGDELLQGFTIDTNSAWIAQTLIPCNIELKQKITIGDNIEDIKSSIESAISRQYDYIFVTGGLGPTHDDITKEAVKQIFDTEYVLDKDYLNDLEKKFHKRGLKMPANNKSQAMILDKADSIPNQNGTALGMRFVNGKSQLFVMPGVPREMKTMVEKEIIPKYINCENVNNITTIKTTGVFESKLAEILNEDIRDLKDTCSFAFLPHYTGVSIRLKKCENYNGRLDTIVNSVFSKLSPFAYGINEDTLSEVVSKKLIQQKMTIATAESCTGGLIAKMFTDIPGSSSFFLGGVVSYSNELKQSMVNVSEELIESHGAVSEQVAIAMAMGIRENTGANIGIGTTGISGPSGGTAEKPIGLVYISVVTPTQEIVKKFNMIPSRKEHREMTANTAINMVRKIIHE